MITFACKKIKQEDLIRCSFNINKTEYNVFMFVLKRNKSYIVSEIAKNMKLERTTVQKALKNLLDKKLIKRTQKNLSKGGYIFIYKINNKTEIKNKIKKIIYNWYKGAEETIDNI